VPTERWVAALRAAVRAELPAAISLRHDLHRHPDLSGSEEATAGRIRRALGPLTGTPVAGPGMLARVGRHDGPAIAVRAELDALPVTEKTGVPWSAPGAVAATPGAINAAVSDARELLTGFGAILAPDLRSCGADDFSYLGCQAARRGQAMSQPEARIATRGYEH